MADICSLCENQYDTYEAYAAHTCERTGFAPTTVEHQDAITDGHFSKIAAAAQERGNERKQEQQAKEAAGVKAYKVSGRVITETESETVDSFVSTTIEATDEKAAEEAFLARYGDPGGKSKLEGFEAEETKG